MMAAMLAPAIAELKLRDGITISVESAGTDPSCSGISIDSQAAAHIRQAGLDVSEQSVRSIRSMEPDVVMLFFVPDEETARELRETILHVSDRIHIAAEDEGGISSPVDKGPLAYQACLASIKRAIPGMLDAIREKITSAPQQALSPKPVPDGDPCGKQLELALA